jgi:predicted transcriptional regulator
MIDFACKQFKLDEIIKCSLGLTKSDFNIMRFLISNRSAFSSSDVANHVGVDVTTAQRALKKLHSKGVLKRNQTNLEGGGYTFFYEAVPKPQIRKIISGIVLNWVKQVESALSKW